MAVSASVAILMPLALTIYLYTKYRISIKSVFIGVLVFVVFQIATRIPLLQYLSTSDWYIEASKNIWFLAFFLPFTAGLFEEAGRFLGFRYLLKDRLEWKNGVAYGIGHGGIESILLVGITMINYVLHGILINSGQFDAMIAPNLSQSVAQAIKDTLINTPSWQFLIAGVERMLTMAIQIGLSLVVLYGVKTKKYIYLLYAILLHMLVDIPAVLVRNMVIAELIVSVFAAASLIFILKSKRYIGDQ